MAPPRRSDSERTISGYRCRIQRELQPPGWAWVTIHDCNGAPVLMCVCREEDVALEIVDHIDRAQNYGRALMKDGS